MNQFFIEMILPCKIIAWMMVIGTCLAWSFAIVGALIKMTEHK